MRSTSCRLRSSPCILRQYLIMNLGLSENFGFVDYEHLVFPAELRVDWIRVYQDPNNINIGCDPPDFPTKAYIDEYVVYPVLAV